MQTLVPLQLFNSQRLFRHSCRPRPSRLSSSQPHPTRKVGPDAYTTPPATASPFGFVQSPRTPPTLRPFDRQNFLFNGHKNYSLPWWAVWKWKRLARRSKCGFQTSPQSGPGNPRAWTPPRASGKSPRRWIEFSRCKAPARLTRNRGASPPAKRGSTRRSTG